MQFCKPWKSDSASTRHNQNKNMKKSLILMASLMSLSLSSFAQGTFAMIWYDGVHGLAIGPYANPGTVGFLLGSEYSAQAYLGPLGSYPFSLTPVAASLVAFDLNGPTRSAAAGGTAEAGSGQFYQLNTIVTSLPIGNVAIQIRAWYNGGQFATYEAALAAGVNSGKSPVMTIGLRTPIDPTYQSLTDIGMSPFSVGVLPEPSTIALLGLGVASLLLFRRRK